MSKTTQLRLLPPVRRLLADLGEHVKLARLRRDLSQQQVCERAGISRPTLREIERGSPGVSLGTLATVLQVLTLEKDLALIARDDELGRRLQDAGLETPKQRSRRRTMPRGAAQLPDGSKS